MRFLKMAQDDTKLNYSSAWSIDQIFLPEPIPLSISIAAAPTPNSVAAIGSGQYLHGLGYLPIIEAQYRSGGMTTWHQCGLPDGFILANWDTSGFGGNPNFYPGLIQTNGIAVSYGFDTQNIYFTAMNYSDTAQTISVRIYLWADKVDY